MTQAERDLDLIDAVVYGDMFDCAVTFEELHRYSRVAASPADLRKRLADPVLSRIIEEHDGYFVVAGRQSLAGLRPQRRARAQALNRRARRLSRLLQYAPFVRAILLTGSLAADDATEDADVDMLIVVAERRLSLTFLILAPLSRILSRAIFCPNYYLSEGHLALRRRNHYSAREVAQAEGIAGCWDRLWNENPWITEFLPNASPRSSPAGTLPGGHLVQRLLELPCSGRLGDRLDRCARRLVLFRLKAHHRLHGAKIPEVVSHGLESDIELRFHGNPRVQRCVERYQKRRCEIADKLNHLLMEQRNKAETRPT